MQAIINVTNLGNNVWIWPDSKISVILNSTVDPPTNGTFTTIPESKIVSYNQEYYQWRWDPGSKKVFLMVKFPNMPAETHVELYGVSLPFKSGAAGDGKIISTNPQHPLKWGYKEKFINPYAYIPTDPLKIYARL